jgi:hypothetical protein
MRSKGHSGGNMEMIKEFYHPSGEPRLETAAEREELKVSLLNEIGKQLARIEKQIDIGVFSDEGVLRDSFKGVTRHLLGLEERMKIQHDITHARLAEQAETLKTYKFSLEAIQGLIVDLGAKHDKVPGQSLTELINRERNDALPSEPKKPTMTQYFIPTGPRRPKPRKSGRAQVKRGGKKR